MAFCIKCGAELAQDAKFCVKCGNPVAAQPAAPVMGTPVVPVMETPEVPVMETPEVPVMGTPAVPVMETPEVPVMETPEVPVMETPEVPVMETPEVPVMETPADEAPIVEQPVMSQPIMEQPVMSQPIMGQPMMEQPVMSQPIMEQPVMGQPVMGQPMMEQPPMGQPMMEQPPMGQPQQAQPMYSPLAQPPKKKKTGLIIGIISALVVAIIAIVVAIVLIMMNSTDEVDLKDCVQVEFDGYDTMGTVYVDMDKTEILKSILKAQGYELNKVKQSDVSKSLESLVDSFEYEVSNTSNLSNGDKITVKLTYDKKLMEKNKLEFKNTELTFTVEGLAEIKEVDPFADITLEFYGTSPNGYVYYDNDSSISCVEYCYFTFDRSDNLSNGDVITLTVDEDDVEYALQNGYRFTTTSKEYTVEGLGFYYQSLDDISDEHMAEFKELAEEEIEDAYYWLDYYATISDLNYVGTYFMKSNDEDMYTSNYLILMYSTTITSVNGDFQPTEIYVPVKITCLEVEAEGELYWPSAVSLGSISVEGQYYSLVGYVTGYDFYKENIEANQKDYTYEATKGMPDFSKAPAVEEPTTPEGESQVPTGGDSETPAEGTESGETETTPAADAA